MDMIQFLDYNFIMMNRIHTAKIICSVKGEDRALVFRLCREQSLIVDQTIDRSFRGCGNKALRRTGEEIDRSCSCVVCVVYGGDCEYQMWKEGHSDWHRANRGVKTKGRGN
jgi:hypothetical protein